MCNQEKEKNKKEKEIAPEKFNLLLRLLREKTDRGAKAFTYLYNRMYPFIRKYITRKYHSKELASDVAHSFFERYRRTEVKQWVLKPNAWTRFICNNIAKDTFRSNGRYQNAYVNISEKDESVDVSKLVLYRDVVEKVHDLGEPTNSIIMLNTHDGYTLKEISQKLDMNYATVRQKYIRGIQKVKEFYNNV